MAVLVFAESIGGKIKKAALEAVTFGYKVAQQQGVSCIALTIGAVEGADVLCSYGAVKVLQVGNVAQFDSQVYASVIAQVAEREAAKVVVFAHSSTGKSVAGRVAARLKAGLVSAVTSLPANGFQVNKNVFSGKGIVTYSIDSAIKVVTISGNTFRPEAVANTAVVESVAVNVPASRITVKQVSTVEGTVPLPEADLVVSAGRGMKGPENWGMIEELAGVLGATTACSRPVADVHWRPHHEHVGQTGVAIKPTLYIAIGISGAIQHLAGVNQSKTIVVINKDADAPFFKAADYGVVGDLFEVVPKLTAALRKYKAQQ